MKLFVQGFLERDFFFLGYFSDLLSSSFFLFFFLTSIFFFFLTIFPQIFLHNFCIIFPKIGVGSGIYRRNKEMGGQHWCTCPLALVYLSAPFLSIMSSTSSAFIFSSFFYFWPDFHVTVWRPFQAPFSSNCICMESSGCLVSNSPSLVLFEARVVEISRSEGK